MAAIARSGSVADLVGYDLRMLPSDPADRATVCPECGHAWKLDGTPDVKGARRG